uniref:AMP-binding domain-containing protein n=2 Tax=Mesocestoides corti TaxID=53468 RepID=A0A5K3EKF8_MESCO
MSDPTPATKLSNLRITDGTVPTSAPPPITSRASQSYCSVDDILSSVPHIGSSQVSPQPSTGGGSADRAIFRPSLTSSTVDPVPSPNEVLAPNQQQSMYQSGLVCPSRVSEKIQQLVNTLKRPKRRPLPEYFIDEDDQIFVQPVVDPNRPKPLGAPTEPLVGEKLIVPSGLPRNIESALQRYAGVIGKTPALTCLEPSGRSTQVLSYAKLLQRSNRIAFLLLNKLGHRGGQSLKPRDRVALVYTSNDPISFLLAFYGCLLASVIPIAIEVPTAKKDSACQNMGFLLSSQDAHVALTNDQVYKSLPRTASGEIAPIPGWPQHLIWINTDHHGGGSGKKVPKDWCLPERLPPEETIYIEYTYAKDGSVRGVMVSRKAVLAHCRALTTACHYSEGDVMVCVVDCRREAGLWHAALASVFNGMHVVFVPFNVLQLDPGSWIRLVTKYRASVAIVKSRDLHWALLAERENPFSNLSSLRALLVTDGHNPWSLNSCDLFAAKFKSRGLNPNAICPIAGSSETLTLSLRRPIPPTSAGTGGLFGIHSNGNSQGVGVVQTSNNDTQQQALLGASAPAAAAAARGIISIQGLSYGVIRVDTEDSFTSLTLQDCGQVLPGATVVVVSLGPTPTVCRTDEVGELCIAADYTGTGYWGLRGKTGSHFCVQPVHEDGRPVVVSNTTGGLHVGAVAGGTTKFVRSGLIGFPGPASSGGLIFICGSIDGVLSVAGRRHNANDIIATVIAVQPTKIVYRGRIAVFSIEMLKDERIVVVAELRHGFSEEAAFSWMSQVLQAVDSIHQVSVYALALVSQNQLPRTPFGGIHVHEVRRLFSNGQLHPIMLLLCPHSAIQNLPQPRTQPPTSLVGASAMLVGQVVQGARMAEAHGRMISNSVHGSMTALGPGAPDLGPRTVTEVLLWRAAHTPEDRLFSVYNAKGAVVASLTCQQLHQKAERLGSFLHEKGNVKPGSVVAIMFMPGIEMVCAFYACLYIAAVPVLVRPPQQPRNPAGAPIGGGSPNSASSIPSSSLFGGSSVDLSASRSSLEPSPPPAQIRFADSITVAWSVVSAAQASVCLTQSSIIKLIKSKEAVGRIPISNWPPLLDYDETWRKKLTSVYQPQSAETEVAYLDFTPSTTGTLTGVEVTHAAASALCRAQKMQCEFYPTRELVLSLEPYSGLSASLWLLTSIYCGHHSILVPPQVTEVAPDLWLTICSQKRIREVFCSYATIKLATIYSARMISSMKMKEVSLENLRSLVIVSEERPRVNLTSLFTKMFAAVNLNSRAVSSSFGCRANLAMCLQGASSPDITTVYVDRVSLRNDRVNLLERGSPNGLCLMESGKLLPGVRVAIANPDTFGQCADSHLGEIWVSSPHNSTRLLGPFNINPSAPAIRTPTVGSDHSSTSSNAAYENAPTDPLKARFVAGDTGRVYARTGFLGFVRRTELTQSDGALHDAVFVVGNLAETMMLRGMRFYPMDIENTVLRSHKKINECAVFTWSDLLVVVVELLGEESEALDLIHPITASVLREHQLIVGVVVVVDRETVRVDFYGEKQRILLRDNFVNDELDPIYVSYNM